MNHIELLYASTLCSKEMEKKLLELDPNNYGFPAQKYHRLLTKGLYKNGVEVKAFSHPRNIEKIMVEEHIEEQEEGIHYSYLAKSRGGYQRLLWNSFLLSYRYLKCHRSAFVICDVLNFTVSFGAALAARSLNRKVIGIITDFPEQLSEKPDLNSRLIWILVSLCTGYVVLTKSMKERLNPKKPAIVLEGHVDSDMSRVDNTIEGKYTKKICLYAGALHKKYGVEKLVKAFLTAEVDDAELHLYGDGDYAEELKTIGPCSIRYLGLASNEEVVTEELKASLLINPRPTDVEFTKYSFPSKNMEYMASGTPLLTTKLPGMPEEYTEHVYLFEDESIEGMSKTIKSVLSYSAEELHQKGLTAKKYILDYKNETEQAKRILEFVNAC